MDIFFMAAFVAPLVALVERNHRRNAGLPGPPLGGWDDRDLERVRHDLPRSGARAPRPTRRRARTQPAPAVCRPAAS